MTTGFLDSTLTAIGMGGLVPAKPAEAPAEAPTPSVAETPPPPSIPAASEEQAPITEFLGFTLPTKEQITETAGKFVNEAVDKVAAVVNTATDTVAETAESAQEFIASSVLTEGDPSVKVAKADDRNPVHKALDYVLKGDADYGEIPEPEKYDIAKPYIKSADFKVVKYVPALNPALPTLKDSNDQILIDGQGRQWTTFTWFEKDKSSGKDLKVTQIQRTEQHLVKDGELSYYKYAKEIDVNKKDNPTSDLLYCEVRKGMAIPDEYTYAKLT